MVSFRSVGFVLGLGLVAAFIQGTVLRSLMPESMIAPNLLVVVVAFLALYEADAWAAVIVFLLGLELDFSSGGLIGPWAGAFVVVFGLLASLSQRIFVESAITAFVAALLACLGSTLMYIALSYQFQTSEAVPVAFSGRGFIEALLTAFCAPILFAILRRIHLVSPARLI